MKYNTLITLSQQIKQVFYKTNCHVLAFAFLIVFGSCKLNAAVYYASPTGTGTGTLASPCNLITGIGKLTRAGDTLYLRGGVYNLTAKVSISKSGTAKARIAIMAYPGEKPILDFSSVPYSKSNPGISVSSTSNYLHIKGLVIRYAGDTGMINNGSNCIIENCEFYGNCDTGLTHRTGGNNLILNCDSHDNFDYQSGGITLANFGGNADGFADKLYTNTNPNTYDGCRSWNNADDGWDFYQKQGSTYIKNCICYKNGPSSFNMANHPRYQVDKAWFDQFPLTVKSVRGTNDLINLATYKNYGNGNGFKLGGNFTAHDVTVTRSLSIGNTVRGFDQNNNYGVMTIYNNSSYQNGFNFRFSSSSGGTLVIKNCVSLSSLGSNDFSSKTVTNENNSWNTTGVTTNSGDFVSLDTSLILAARNADGSFTTTFMNLIAGSDLIDAGLDVGLPYAGKHPDLGYYEKGIIDQFPPALTAQNTSQTVTLGSAIATIKYTWSGGATGVITTNIPKWMKTTLDTINKTLTLQGTPSALGSYTFTVTSVGGAGSPVVINGSVFVTSSTGKKIAYFTTLPISAADTAIYNKLTSNPSFSITPVDATSTTIDYTGYDAIVMSSVPGSTAAGFPALEAVDKPKLLLKPFILKTTAWNWINTTNAVNTSDTSVTIIDTTHPIFSGLTFTGTANNQLQLFSTLNTNAVTGITNASWIATPAITVLGTAIGNSTTNSVVEIPVGTNMNGTTTTKRFIMIGLSENSTANLNTTGKQLIENSLYYILGLSVPLPIDFKSVHVSANNGFAKVSWKVGVEANIKQYKVQRSANGVDFTTIANLESKGISDYAYDDNLPLNGKYFYRIIAEEKSGKALYSPVVTLEKFQENVGITILNNPTVDKKIQLQLKNVAKGKVVARLFNSAMKEVFTTNFNYDGGLALRTLNIPTSAASGMYVIQVTVSCGQTYCKWVIVK